MPKSAMIGIQNDEREKMKTYDLCGSVRIVAKTEDEALDIMDKLVRSGQIEDYHINEIEVQ